MEGRKIGKRRRRMALKKKERKKKGIFNSISMRLRLSENNELGAQFGAGLVQDGQPAGF